MDAAAEPTPTLDQLAHLVRIATLRLNAQARTIEAISGRLNEAQCEIDDLRRQLAALPTPVADAP